MGEIVCRGPPVKFRKGVWRCESCYLVKEYYPRGDSSHWTLISLREEWNGEGYRFRSVFSKPWKLQNFSQKAVPISHATSSADFWVMRLRIVNIDKLSPSKLPVVFVFTKFLHWHISFIIPAYERRLAQADNDQGRPTRSASGSTRITCKVTLKLPIAFPSFMLIYSPSLSTSDSFSSHFGTKVI